ncbi:MAG: hypothetical protein Q9216_002023 [Gyalolechia sp. 2 TL-2023]
MTEPSRNGRALETTVIWPPCPYNIPILRRKGSQSIIITQNDRQDHGLSAHDLASRVCRQMTNWIARQPRGSILGEPHWEKDAYGETHAVELTIWMKLVPDDMSHSPLKLEREMAFFAMEEYCDLVGVYGAMQGEFEYWAWGHRMAVTNIYIWQWPQSEVKAVTA